MSYQPFVCACPICAGGKSLVPGGSSGSSLLPAPPNPVIANPIYGDYRIDSLVENAQYRWNKDSAPGTSVNVTYSFMSAKPTYGGTDEIASGTGIGFTPLTQQQIDATRAVFARVASETGLRFNEISDSSTSYGQIRLGNNTQSTSAGYAYMPNSTGDDKDGDIWLDKTDPANLINLAPGTSAYATLIHEIGHALGLKHPGNYNGGEPVVPSAVGNFLGQREDNLNYSIMSYRDAPGATGVQRDWFGTYDLLTLRALYGSGTAQTGNTNYALGDSAGRALSIIYDANGVDTLDVSSSAVDSKIDLRPGAFSSIGVGAAGPASNNISIDFFTIIENFVGSSRNDAVTGNAANNTFNLGGGTNSADGGTGVDTAVYGAAANIYRIANTAGTLTVTGNGAVDTLTNIERLQFSDKKLAFDANALTTAKILGAVFGKVSVANTEYAGIGLSILDAGSSYADLMKLALNARLGVGASNEVVVTTLYTNLVGNAPNASELNFYSGLISSGQLSQTQLGMVAADNALNIVNIDLVGIAATGLLFI